MKVLITGGTGFIGSHVVDCFLEHGYPVRCLVRRTSNLRWLKDKPLELAYSSLLDVDGLRGALKGVDVVVHVAGSLVEKNWKGFQNSNVRPVELLLQLALEQKSFRKFVLVSSTGAAGPSPNGRPLTEDDPPNPVSDYGRSKLEGERVARTFMDRIPVTIVRPSAVYGPRDSNFLLLFKQAISGIAPVLGGEEHYANLVFAPDLARGILSAAESPVSEGQTYNLASVRPYARSEFMAVIADVCGRQPKVIALPKGPVLALATANSLIQKRILGRSSLLDSDRLRTLGQRYWAFDVSKAIQELNFEERYSLVEGMRESYQFYQDQGWLAGKRR